MLFKYSLALLSTLQVAFHFFLKHYLDVYSIKGSLVTQKKRLGFLVF